jgi:hypothetical protein
VIVAAVILIFTLPRKYAIAPLLFTIFIVPLSQVVVLAGFHFTVPRVLILAGLCRWAISARGRLGNTFSGGVNWIDRIFVLFAIMAFITYSLEYMQAQATIKSAGTLLDMLGGYCVVKYLVRDKNDVRRVIKVFAAVAVVVGMCMIGEQVTQMNILWLLGGTDLSGQIREGHFRSQGAFNVYLTAGAFGATLVPLLVWLWSGAKDKVFAGLGMAGATVMAATSFSSSPILAYVAGIAALCFWPLRKRLRLFRWGIVCCLIGLQMVMKAPVWALIGRANVFGASSGYHRFMLVDNFIRHFGDWWLLGFKNYQDWGWDMWDLSNQFVAWGLTGGLVTLCLAIALFCLAFAGLGRARRLAATRENRWLLWCLGAALFAHLIAFFGMSYFDQMQFVFYSLLAMISVTVSRRSRRPARKIIDAPETPATEAVALSC